MSSSTPGSAPLLIISGASRGIGLATARQFLAAGWDVLTMSRQAPPEPAFMHIPVDLCDANALLSIKPQLLSAAQDRPKICIVHNAALYHKDTIQTVTAETLRANFEVGLVAPMQLNQWLFASLPRGSSILYVGSTLSEKAVPGAASYTVTKHALVGLMRATCQDAAGGGVHTACICPGFTDTEMLRTHIPDAAVMQQLVSQVTQQRLLTPEEIAQTLWFAAQQPAINGAVIHANLGQVGS